MYNNVRIRIRLPARELKMHKNVGIRIALVLCYQKIFTPALKVVCPLRKSKDGIFGDVLAAGEATLLAVIRRRSIIGVDIFW